MIKDINKLTPGDLLISDKDKSLSVYVGTKINTLVDSTTGKEFKTTMYVTGKVISNGYDIELVLTARSEGVFNFTKSDQDLSSLFTKSKTMNDERTKEITVYHLKYSDVNTTKVFHNYTDGPEYIMAMIRRYNDGE